MDMESLVVPLLLNLDQYNKGLEEAEKKASSIGKGISAIGAGVVGLASAGVGALGIYTVGAVKNAMEAEKIQAQLNSVLESTGGISGMTAQSVNDLATSYSQMTTFEDDAIVSAENMLLTFTNINSNVFPQATGLVLDLSTAMGTDLKSSSILVGKALNDPINGVSALTRVGVSFTDQQKEQIRIMTESGDVAGAQAIIIGELTKEFGGSAEAVGGTFTGQLEILKNTLGNVSETIGGVFLPILTKLATDLVTFFNRDDVQIWVNNFANGLALVATWVAEKIPLVIQTFQNIVGWLQNNQPVIVGILGALGVAVAVFAYSSATALWAMMSPLLPIIAVMVAIGVVVGALYAIWISDFGGIRTFLTNFWNNSLKPIFETIKQWLSVNVPIAIKFLSDTWNNVLLPALKVIWAYLSENVFPLFQKVGEFVGAVFSLYFKVLAGIFQNIVVPAFKAVWQFLQDKIFPILVKVGGWVAEKLAPAFNNLATVLKKVADWFGTLAGKINNLKLPSWLTPGSPFPFTYALMGLNDELRKSAKQVLPEFSAQLNVGGSMPQIPSVAQSSNSQDLTKAIQGISNDPIDYTKLARVLSQELVKAMG